jgi:hypothetical protein
MAPRPYELSRRIEELARQNSAESIPVLFAELKELCYELKGELKTYLERK